jgi:ubiquitin-protein ligase
MSPTVRHRRLTADFQMVQTLASNSGGTLAIERVAGDPPERYIVVYRCKGIERLEGTRPVYRDVHRVQIDLSASYPAQKPAAAMLTPLFHPHVFANNVICLGAKWTVAEYLDSLILRIGSIIQYDPQYFDFNSPANKTAATWAQQNMRLFPIGRCTFKLPRQASGTISWTNIK